MNYVSIGRTNYFKVKDKEEFLIWASQFSELEIVTDKSNGSFCLLAPDGFPNRRYNTATEEDDGIDIVSEVIPRLAPGEIAIFHEVGYEGLRGMGGWTTAATCEGLIAALNLGDIYGLVAKKTGRPITEIMEQGGD